MAIVSCPDCGKKLKIADTSIGKKVKGPCGHVFLAQSEGSAAAAPKPAPVAQAITPEKVYVSCTECGAKLKVATTSLGKKMKCPKCAAVFIAAMPDDEGEVPEAESADSEPAPKAKTNAAPHEDMDDLLAFGQADAAPAAEDDDNPFQNEPLKSRAQRKADEEEAAEEDMPKSKGKAKPRSDDEQAQPKGKKPSSFGKYEDTKPVYPSRILANIVVILLLLLFGGFVAGIFFFKEDFNPAKELGLPEVTVKPKGGKFQGVGEPSKEAKEAEAAVKKELAKFDGTWVVQSAEKDGMPVDKLKSDKYVFAAGKVNGPDLKDATFKVDPAQKPRWLDIATPQAEFFLGIYEFVDADTIKWCSNTSGEIKGNILTPENLARRPKDFDSKHGTLYTLTRAKAADKGTEKDTERNKVLAAKAQIGVLTSATQAYAIKSGGDFPPTLDRLLEKTDRGGPYLQDKEALLDPWNQRYQYDPLGKKNQNLRPDIWTVTPDKQVLGNWPADGDKGKDPKDKGGKDKDAKDPAAKLDGAWIVEFMVMDGKKNTEQRGEPFIFADGKVTGLMPFPVGYTVDTAVEPHAINLVSGVDGAPMGIYRIDGDKLQLGLANDQKAKNRPKKFDAPNVVAITLKRAGKGEVLYSRRQSEMNLKNIALAMHNFHEANKHLPTGIVASNDKSGKVLLSWRVALLPYFGPDGEDLLAEFDLTKPWDDPANKKMIARMPKIYAVPFVEAKEGMTHYRAFTGPGTPLEPRKKTTLLGLSDGTSNTIFAVEAAEPTIWTKPDDLPYDAKAPLPKFGVSPTGFNVVMFDAVVHFVRPTTPGKVIRPYLTGNNGTPREPLGEIAGFPKRDPKDLKDKDGPKDLKDKDLKDGKDKDGFKDGNGKDGKEKDKEPKVGDAVDRVKQEKAWLAELRKKRPTEHDVAIHIDAHGVVSLFEPAESTVGGAAFAPKSLLVAFAVRKGDDSGVVLWDPLTRTVKKRLPTAVPGYEAIIAFSPDEQFVALAAGDRFGDKFVKVWKLADGAEVKSLKIKNEPRDFAFSTDGKLLTCVSPGIGESEVKIWTTADWKEHPMTADLPSAERSYLLSSDGDDLISSAAGKKNHLHHMLRTGVTTELKSTEAPRFICKGWIGYVKVNGGDPALELIDRKTGKTHSFPVGKGIILRNHVTADGRYVFCDVLSEEVGDAMRIVDTATGKLASGPIESSVQFSFSPGGAVIARSVLGQGQAQLLAFDELLIEPAAAKLGGGKFDDAARAAEIAARKKREEFLLTQWSKSAQKGPEGVAAVIKVDAQEILTSSISPTQPIAALLIRGKDGKYFVQLWDLEKLKPGKSIPFELEGHSPRLVFSPDGKLLAIEAAEVHVWKVADGSEVKTFTSKTRTPDKLRFSADSKRLIVIAAGRSDAYVWDTESWTVAKLNARTDRAISFALDPAGEKIIQLGPGKNLKTYDVISGAVAEVKLPDTPSPLDTYPLPGGRMVVYTYFLKDKVHKIQLVDIQAGKTVTIGQANNPMAFQFSPDGKQATYGAEDKQLAMSIGPDKSTPGVLGRETFPYVSLSPGGAIVLRPHNTDDGSFLHLIAFTDFVAGKAAIKDKK